MANLLLLLLRNLYTPIIRTKIDDDDEDDDDVEVVAVVVTAAAADYYCDEIMPGKETTMKKILSTTLLATGRWGLLPPWAKDAKQQAKLINARSETVAES